MFNLHGTSEDYGTMLKIAGINRASLDWLHERPRLADPRRSVNYNNNLLNPLQFNCLRPLTGIFF